MRLIEIVPVLLSFAGESVLRLIAVGLLGCGLGAGAMFAWSQRHLRQRDESRLKDAFLTSLSHELRTPLNAVLGMSDLLQAAHLNREERSYLEVMRKSGDSMLRMVDSLLDILSIQAGTLQLRSIPFHLRRLIRTAAHAARLACNEKGLAFHIDIDAQLERGFRGDPDRIAQIIESLLDNAVKFTDRGSIGVRVRGGRIGTSARGEQVRSVIICVSDTGIGIAPERRRDIFRAFTRVDGSVSRRTGGLGVGLSMVHHLSRHMGGRAGLRERSGEDGSEFQVSLPLVVAEDAFVDVPVQFAKADSEQAAHGDMTGLAPKILLVEDNPDNRMLFEAYVRATASQVDIAENGNAAVAKFKEQIYDVVFMDIQMPKKDGIAATREIRAWEREAIRNGQRAIRVPIFALTAHSLPEEVSRSIAAGCDGHIAKPVRKERILALLQDVDGHSAI